MRIRISDSAEPKFYPMVDEFHDPDVPFDEARTTFLMTWKATSEMCFAADNRRFLSAGESLDEWRRRRQREDVQHRGM